MTKERNSGCLIKGGHGHGEKKYVFRTGEICRLLGISKWTLRRWQKEGKIDCSLLESICKHWYLRRMKK